MKSWRAWLLLGLLVWILIVAWWAASPVSDSVPTGLDKNKAPTAQTVDCDSPLSGNAKSSGPLPVLPAGRSYERTPCALPHKNYRIIFAIDIAVVLAVVIVLAKTWKPALASPSLEDVSAA
jgi:hypothetical protein